MMMMMKDHSSYSSQSPIRRWLHTPCSHCTCSSTTLRSIQDHCSSCRSCSKSEEDRVTKSTHSLPVIKAGDVTLKAVIHFCYLGSILSTDVNADTDISARIVKASSSFGRLSKRLWSLKRSRHSAWHRSSSIQISCSVSPAVWLWILDAISSLYQKARPVSYEMPPTNSSHQLARQDLKYGSPSEMSNYQHRSVPANSATPMDRTRRKNGQQPSAHDDLLRPLAARGALTWRTAKTV